MKTFRVQIPLSLCYITIKFIPPLPKKEEEVIKRNSQVTGENFLV